METSDNISLSAPENDKTPASTGQQPVPATETDNTDGHNHKLQKRRKLVIYGLIAVIAGWLSMLLNPWVSMTFTIGGLVMSSLGVRIPPGPRRDLAITSIIAASVLLLVYVVFAVIFYVLLG